MTIDDSDQIDADMRRASALLAHYVAKDRDGVNAVLDEAEQLGRLRPLASAEAAVIASLQNGWEDQRGAAVLRRVAQGFAAKEHEDES